MSDSYELQKAVAATLSADSGIRSVLGDPARLYDDVPDKAVCPFVFFGEDEEANIGEECTAGSFHIFSLTVCDTLNFAKTKAISAAIVSVLDGAEIEISGYEKCSIYWRGTSHRRNADNVAMRQATILFETEMRKNA